MGEDAQVSLMTIGYEGVDIHTFIASLTSNRVAVLIDVRELPLSRKKYFSKSALSAAIQDAGMDYRHVPALGCPRNIRKEYRMDADWERYRRRFNRYLKTQSDSLLELRDAAYAGRCCLMCFEADHRFCHRSLVTEALARQGNIEIRHLAPARCGERGSHREDS